jgi:hypothetical protein
MIFVPDAIAPLDDPAIQFPSGSRQISFVIPANALQARFFGASQLGPTIFQTGTVAGILRLEAVLNAGTEQSTITRLFTISRAAPSIQKVQIDERNGFNILLTLWSTPRDVTQLTLDFRISPRVSLSCGSAPGCVAERSTLTFDVAELFRAWYANDTRFGSLALLRLPLSINGSIDGSVVIRLHNSHGVSNEVAVPLP